MSNTNPPSVPTAAAVTKVKPPDPKMGTTEETYQGSGHYYYAFGGAPDSKWTGIADLDKRLLADTCCRPTDRVTGQKASTYRVKGLETKYSEGVKLSDFQKKIWEHLRTHGLDTVSFLPDPQGDSTAVVPTLSVVTHHARFTGNMIKAIESSNQIKNSYDRWDKAHDSERRV